MDNLANFDNSSLVYVNSHDLVLANRLNVAFDSVLVEYGFSPLHFDELNELKRKKDKVKRSEPSSFVQTVFQVCSNSNLLSQFST